MKRSTRTCESLQLLVYWESQHWSEKACVRLGGVAGIFPTRSQRRTGSVFGSVKFLIITPPGLVDLKDKQAQDRICTQQRWWWRRVRRRHNALHSTAQNSCWLSGNATSAGHRRLRHLITLSKQPAQWKRNFLVRQFVFIDFPLRAAGCALSERGVGARVWVDCRDFYFF